MFSTIKLSARLCCRLARFPHDYSHTEQLDKILKTFPWFFDMMELVGKDPKIQKDALANGGSEMEYEGLL